MREETDSGGRQRWRDRRGVGGVDRETRGREGETERDRARGR